jgi:predicted  nucleic acid-binding Zn-ribbon protein
MSTAIGKAALVLSADASGAKAGLAKFGADTKAWAEKTGQQVSGQLRGAFLAGGVAGLVGGSLTGGVTENIEAIKHWSFGIEAIKSKAEATKALLEQSVFLMERNAKFAGDWREAMISPADKIASIDKELKQIAGPLNDALHQLDTAKARVNQLEGSFVSTFGGKLGLSAHNEQLEGAKTEMTAASDANRAMQKRIDELHGERAKLTDPWKNDEKLKGAFDKSLKEMSDSIVALRMSPLEKQLKVFEDLGVPNHELKIMADRIASVTTETKKFELEKDFEDIAKQLENAARFAGKTADEITRINLVDRKADAGQLARFDSLQKTKDWTTALFDAAGAVAEGVESFKSGKLELDNAPLIRGTSAEVSARIKNDFGAKVADKQLAEQVKANALLTKISDAIAAPMTAGLTLLPM